MERTGLFSIGTIGKMFHLSVSSLRHYEAIGLLMPEYIDPESGYRYYSTRQFEVLNTIRYLRALDMPLQEISDFMENRDVERMEEKLLLQKQAVIEKQKRLKCIEQKIDNRLRQIADAKKSIFDVVKLVPKKACRIVWVKDSLKIQEILDIEEPLKKLEQQQAEALIFLGKVGVGISKEHLTARSFGQYDGVFLMLDEEDTFSGDTDLLPETLCVSIRFRGGHMEAAEQYGKLMDYVEEHRLTVNGFSREITMIDYGLTNDTDKFVTEISIPVT